MKIIIVAFAALASVLTGCTDSSDSTEPVPTPPPQPEPTSSVSARVAVAEDLLAGPLARGVPGDYVLENGHLRVIIQQPGRQW